MPPITALGRPFPSLILLLSLLSAFPALATDMYLPALPLLQQSWGQPLRLVNLSLVAFFVAYCLLLLVYGPLSDRYGRRPPLLAGIALFIGSSFACAAAQGVHMMIVGRFLQGAGAASASSLVFAISKDRFDGPARQQAFVQIGAIVAAAPMIAPIIGGWIITYASWRWIFLLQALLAFFAALGVARMQEPLQSRNVPSLRQLRRSYLNLVRNRRYMRLLTILSLICAPIFAFIGGSSDLYMNHLGYSAQEFGLFFAFNSVAFVLAPLSFSRISKKYGISQLLPLALIGMLAGSLLLLSPLLPQPQRLTLSMFCTTFCFAFCRPAGNNFILEQVSQDSGAASSLMVFSYFMTGALAMWFFSWEWEDKMQVLSLMGIAPVLIALGLWRWFMRSEERFNR